MTARSQFRILAAAFLGCAFAPSPAVGGAWTPAQGTGVVISKVEFETASAKFDGAGDPAAGDFYKLHVEAYGELGLTDFFTLVGQVDYDQSWIETEGEPAASEGFGRFALWGRTRFWTGQTDVASVQAGFEIPGDREGLNAPKLGAEPAAVSVRGLYGRGYSSDWGTGFLDAQAGLLFRAEGAPTQAELDLTAGHFFFEDIMLLGQFFNTYSLEHLENDPLDFDESKASLALGWKAVENATILLGVSADVATRGIEPSRSVFISHWRTF